VETGSQYRKQRFKMAMERLIENNPALDNPKARDVLETARDEAHMVQIAEAILGTRAKLSEAKESSLGLKCESDGFFRLVVDGKLHEKVLDGQTMWEALRKMGIQENEIEAAFDDALDDAGMTYKKPEGVEGEPYVMVPMEPVEEPGAEGGEMDLELDFGGEEGGEDVDFGGAGGEEVDDDEDVVEEGKDMDYVGGGRRGSAKAGEPVKPGPVGRGRDPKAEEEYGQEKGSRERMAAASADIKKSQTESQKGRFRRYLESRGIAKPQGGKKPINESKGGRRQVGGSRRMSESLPPSGGAPTSQPPAVSQGAQAPAAPMGLTERIIARKNAEKKRAEEARREQANRMNLQG
jgi:hypothetical protein